MRREAVLAGSARPALPARRRARRLVAAALALAGAMTAALPAGAWQHGGRDYTVTLVARAIDGPITDVDGRKARVHFTVGQMKLAAPGLTGAESERPAIEAAARAWCREVGPGLQRPGNPLVPKPQFWFAKGGWKVLGLCKAPHP